MNSDSPNDSLTVYHNPRCSKSRAIVQILQGRGVPFTLYHYLEENPKADQLRRLMTALAIEDPRTMMRTKEAVYSANGLADASPEALLEAMVAHPELIERPIVIRGDRAVIARPPDRVSELLA